MVWLADRLDFAQLLSAFIKKFGKLSIIFLVLCIFGLSFYRLFCHPLKRYPGPRGAALTNWYATSFAARGIYHRRLRDWHRQYGPIVRVAPNTLSFNSHQSYLDIYGRKANNSKHDTYNSLSASRGKQNVLSVVDKGIATFKRRIYLQVFSTQGMKNVEERLLSHFEAFTSLLSHSTQKGDADKGDGWGTPINMAERCIWLTHDVITELCFSKSSAMQASPELRHFPSTTRFMSFRGILCILQPQIYKLKLDKILLAPAYSNMMELGHYAWRRAEERTKSTADDKYDLFTGMMNGRDEKRDMEFSFKDYWVESILMLGAGVITSGPTLSTVFCFLLHDSEALQRVTEEVRTCFSSVDDIRDGEQLSKCAFLHACVDETMRMVPGVPNLLPRRVLDGGALVDNEFIPEGTVVGGSLYSVQRNPEEFEEPDRFKPDRWMSGDEEIPPSSRRSFFPFGYGPRTCVGLKLALAELHIVVARAVFLFDMRLAPDAPCCTKAPGGKCTDREFHGYVGLHLDGPMAQFRPRQESP